MTSQNAQTRNAADQDWEDGDDAKIDRYHAGYVAHRKGQPRPTGADEGEGWDDRARACKVVYVAPRRPEGYYHAPIGTFD